MADNRPVERVDIIDEQTNGLIAVAPSGAFTVGEVIRLVGGNFETGVLPTTQWQQNDVNGATAVVVNGELVARTNTTADGAAYVQTLNRARFITATFNIAHLAIQMPGRLNTDVVRRWGAFDPVSPVDGVSQNGVYFENNSGAISVNRIRGGVVVDTVPLANFNGNKIPGTNTIFVEDENVHVYELMYNAGLILFMQDRRLVHRMGSVASVAYNTVHLGLGLSCVNINGNTVDNQLLTRGFSISRIGTPTANPNKFVVAGSGSGSLKNSPGTLRRVVIMNVGVGGASLSIYDSATPAGTPLFTLDLTDTLTPLEFGFDFNEGLSYSATGTQFEVMIIFD